MNHDHIHWLGHASFCIEDGPKRIFFDPWKLSPSVPLADLILITHSHYDHFSIDDIRRITKDTTAIVAPVDVAKQLKGNVIALKPGETLSIQEWTIETIPAYNLGKQYHQKANNWVGYILTLSHGQRIYHAGDTDFTPEMRNVRSDVALLPCGGTYTMTAKEAAAAANAFRPKLVIPMHWGDIVGSKNDAEEVKKAFQGETVIKSPER
ncbi:MAG TPA: MBL fold metallo-hydrolase [Bacteroidota bacterium]|nr:MBL fold metallo-hydrolase [Bacteroidota bacterium]